MTPFVDVIVRRESAGLDQHKHRKWHNSPPGAQILTDTEDVRFRMERRG